MFVGLDINDLATVFVEPCDGPAIRDREVPQHLLIIVELELGEFGKKFAFGTVREFNKIVGP